MEKFSQPDTELFSDLRMSHREVDRCLHIFELVPGIIVLTILYLDSIEWDSLRMEIVYGIGEPYLSSLPWSDGSECSEYLRWKYICTMSCEIARSILWIWFFHDLIDRIDIVFDKCHISDTITFQVFLLRDTYT